MKITPKDINNKHIAFISTLSMLILLIVHLKLNLTGLSSSKSNTTKLTFFNVGSGDSILLEHDDVYYLIDGGPNYQIDWYLGTRLSPLFCKLDFIFLSHPHADHLFGLNRVVDRCKYRVVFQNITEYESDLYSNWIDKTENYTRSLYYPEKIIIGDISIYVLWPDEDYENYEINNQSIVLLLDYKDFEALLMGDLESDEHDKIENRLKGYSSIIDSGIDVYKVPHHGAQNAFSKKFMLWLRPRIAVISVGENTYGHPYEGQIDFLEGLGTLVYRTDESGNIVITLD